MLLTSLISLVVHGLEGIKITRVSCGSSHSVAWTFPEPPSDLYRIEPVSFPTTKDPLGSSATGTSFTMNKIDIDILPVFLL